MKLLGGDEGVLQLEILDLQHSSALRSKHNDSVESIPTDCWMIYINVRLSRALKALQESFDNVWQHRLGSLL